jgi:hypothetical protein
MKSHLFNPHLVVGAMAFKVQERKKLSLLREIRSNSYRIQSYKRDKEFKLNVNVSEQVE